MFGLVEKSYEEFKFKVHEMYLIIVTKHSTHLKGQSGEEFDRGAFRNVLVETSWELELFDITGEVRKLHCRSEDWGDLQGQEGPWSVTNALYWMQDNIGPKD